MANYTKEEQFDLIRKDLDNLKIIDNKEEEVCLEVVKENGWYIRYIENPTEEMKLEAVKSNGWAIESIGEVNNEICFNALLSILSRFDYVEENINIDYNNFKIKNGRFIITERFISDYFDEYNIDLSRINVSIIDMSIFKKLKDYLIYFNTDNCFILDHTVDLKIMKEIAITNNELIYTTYNDREKLNDICKVLVDKIITADELLKF